MKNNKKLFLSIMIVLIVVLTTVGVTLAIFNYRKNGLTESVIKTGGISFYYDEMTKRGVSITDALPVDSNEDAKESSNYFEFRITANSKIAEIPYVLTARLSEDSDMPLTGIRVYLTKVNDGVESEVLYTTLDQLTEKRFLENNIDKVLYRDRVLVDGNSYEQKYRLRIWIDEDVNFGDGSYNDKKLSLQVNVYTNEGESLTEEHLTYPGDTRIKMLTANNQYLLADSSETGIDYEVVVPNEVASISFETITQNVLANATITSLGTTPVVNSENYNIVVGSNYFRVRVTSADSSTTKDYKVKVERELSKDNSLTYLSVDGYAFTDEFTSNNTSYTVSNGVETSSITISANNPNGATITGTGTKSLTWGTNTFNVTVQAQDPTVSPKTYTITVNNVRPTAPALTGGTGETTSDQDVVISIESPGTAVSGVDHYEYYIASTNTQPTDNTAATGTTSNSVTLTDDGTYYVYYRTVSISGNNSLWSDVQVVNIMKGTTLAQAIKRDNSLITPYTNNGFTGTAKSQTGRSGYYYTYSSSYTFDGTTGTYTLNNPQTCKLSSCYETLKGKYVVSYQGVYNNSTVQPASGLETIYQLTTSTTSSVAYYIAPSKTSQNGLYQMNTSNGFGGTGNTTYIFHEDVANNVVSFAGKTWRVIRINEDGTVRLILDTSASSSTFDGSYTNMYYSDTGNYIKKAVDNWYNSNIGNNSSYSSKVASGNYFCEAAKVKYSVDYTSGSATMVPITSYKPALNCNVDGNNKQYVSGSVGLITYDEVVLAGGKVSSLNKTYYLYKGISKNNSSFWTMSSAGIRPRSQDGDDPESYNHATVWISNYSSYHGLYAMNICDESWTDGNGTVHYEKSCNYGNIRPVINIRTDALINETGTGTASNPYVIQ